MPPAKRACKGLKSGCQLSECRSEGKCALEYTVLLHELRECKQCKYLFVVVEACPVCAGLEERGRM